MFCFFFVEIFGNATDEHRLFKFLMQDYEEWRLVRPVLNRSEPVVVTFSAELVGVAKVVMKLFQHPRFAKDVDMQSEMCII